MNKKISNPNFILEIVDNMDPHLKASITHEKLIDLVLEKYIIFFQKYELIKNYKFNYNRVINSHTLYLTSLDIKEVFLSINKDFIYTIVIKNFTEEELVKIKMMILYLEPLLINSPIQLQNLTIFNLYEYSKNISYFLFFHEGEIIIKHKVKDLISEFEIKSFDSNNVKIYIGELKRIFNEKFTKSTKISFKLQLYY